MTDKKHSCEKEFEKSGVKFPCGSFETMLKVFRECGLEKKDTFDCAAMMKKFSKSPDGKSGYAAIMQNLCCGKEGPIDCKAVMEELFGSMKTKTE
jgi:hypothetical protein